MSGKRTAASSARRSTPGPQAVSVSASWQFGQSFGAALDVAAMMADERRAEAVLDQPCGAIGTFEAVAAGPAQRQGSIAAPIEEQERLLAAAPRLFDPGDRARRQPSAALRPLALKIDGSDAGQRRLAEPRGEREPAVASGLGVEPRLERRRGRGEHDRRLFEPRAHDRHVARIVDDPVLLLIGAVVLLVDDDEAKVGERQEQSRTRADHYPRFTLRRRGPDALALALGEPRVPFGRPRAEPGREPVEELRGERNLRQEHEPLAPLPERFGDGLEINLGLARSGHPFEQGGRERAFGDPAAEIVGRGALIGVEAGHAKTRVERRRDRLGRQRDRDERAVGDETVDDAGR